jgi:uncharacterized membrane protein
MRQPEQEEMNSQISPKERLISVVNKFKKSGLYRIEFLSFVLTGLAVIIVVVFVIRLWNHYDIFRGSNISMPITGNAGDFIGGVVGTVLSFVGVLLFYVALRVQQEELRQQRKELTNQRLEFKISRCTNAIYAQISRVNLIIEDSNFILLTGNGPVTKVGYIGVMELAELLDGPVNLIESMPGSQIDLNNDLDMIEGNYGSIVRLVNITKASVDVINKLVSSSPASNRYDNLTTEEINDLKYIFSSNIGEVVFNLISNVQILLNHYFEYNALSENSEPVLLHDSQATYLYIKTEVDKCMTQIAEYGHMKRSM